MGGSPATPRGRGVRCGAGRAGGGRVRDDRGRAALRRGGGGAPQGACLRRACLGPTGRRGWATLRRSRRRERGASRSGGDRRGEGGATVPRAAPSLAPVARRGPVCRAGGPRRPHPRIARLPAWRGGLRAAGAGGEAGVEPRARRGTPARAWAIARGRAGRGALLPRGGRERAHSEARVRCAARQVARPAGARAAPVPEARARGAARRRRLVAAHGDPAGGDRGARAAALGPRPQAHRDPGARGRAAARGRGARGARGAAARVPRARGRGDRRAPAGGASPGACERRRRRGRRGRRGRAVVAHSRDPGVGGSSRDVR